MRLTLIFRGLALLSASSTTIAFSNLARAPNDNVESGDGLEEEDHGENPEEILRMQNAIKTIEEEETADTGGGTPKTIDVVVHVITASDDDQQRIASVRTQRKHL